MLPVELTEPARRVGALLRARGETVAVAEGSAGGLVSAALLSVPGASAYYLGGAVVYTVAAVRAWMAGPVDMPKGMRGATETFADYLARSSAAHLGTTWGIGEAGAGRAGQPVRRSCGALVGGGVGPGVPHAPRPHRRRRTRAEHGRVRRVAALALLEEVLNELD